MKTIVKTLTLQSEKHYGQRVPPQPVGEILRTLPGLIQGTIRMSFEGRSTARGRRPPWLEAASDVRFIEHRGDDVTVLYFEMPLLGEAAEELYEQQELWTNRPDPEDTPFDLLADVIEDVRNRSKDSERFDRPLLKKLSLIGRGLNGTFQSCLISGKRCRVDHVAKIDNAVITSANELTQSTPHPQQIRLTGVLDMIRASTNTIGIQLQTGEDVRGAMINGNAINFHDMLNQKITLMGKAIYRPSGNLLRVDVAEVRAMQSDDAFFTDIPAPRRHSRDSEVINGHHHQTSNIAAIIGRWPGEESEEELKQAMQELG